MPDVLTRENIAQTLGPANANAQAQTSGQGLGIENIRRGVLFVTALDVGNSTVPNATSGFAALAEPVSGEIHLSGRPLLIMVQATTQAGASGDVRLSAHLRGVEVTGSTNGIPGTFNGAAVAAGRSGWWIVPRPQPGRATVEVVADAATSDATVYSDANNAVALLAVEL